MKMTFQTLRKKGYSRRKALQMCTPRKMYEHRKQEGATDKIMDKIGLTKEQIQRLIGATK